MLLYEDGNGYRVPDRLKVKMGALHSENEYKTKPEPFLSDESFGKSSGFMQFFKEAAFRRPLFCSLEKEKGKEKA